MKKNVVARKDQITSELLLYGEWLVTNGIGGFACGSISGTPMRKYHSLLNAAMPAPLGRTVMLNYVQEEIKFHDQTYPLSFLRTDDNSNLPPTHLKEFRLENGIPFWVYEIESVRLEKSLFLINRQNTLCLSYKLLSNDPIELKWRPFFHFRTCEAPVNLPVPFEKYSVTAKDSHYEVECPNYPTLRIFNDSSALFTVDFQIIDKVFYEIEAKRGYESEGSLKSPGFFTGTLKPGEKISLVVSTESWDTLHALTPREARVIEKVRKKNLLKRAGSTFKNPTISKLILAADQFLMTPLTRPKDKIRLEAGGEEVKSIVAGFPWFTDWGRDTMISLEGLTLCTGRARDAYAILNTFASYMRNGLIPNMFPDGETLGIYNTADATLWFFHAIDRYIEITKDDDILELLLPKLHEAINYHMQGTEYGIKMDPEDGLLMQGEKGLQLTWMDAKVGDWVVTPRRGKAVEINGLWYNALKLYETWTGKQLEITQKCFESFNKKFWNPALKYLYDVVDGEAGNDPALRPNQLFSISLKHPVLKEEYWKDVLDSVDKELLTPVGLRTLSPKHPDYQPFYDGDLHARDAAYHQGTIWPWLLGPYVDVYVKVHPDCGDKALEILKGIDEHFNNNCMGTIGEIFDASQPYHARGCFAQAWSVAEILRSFKKLAPD